ncbi:MDR family MFS transporter [Paenibacillus qinlingensis]|uniref:EmrB/QacA subfamily drug resistance transporter n=1 Tax=Paenibacillus qinlingensis TaxID=1837343 RepID=A0ABU1P5W0_9BACL|nr:MDR family MFS transporter [Paenibacillus qinlingensis]MDR6554582.1 EmrB/QacA subfamily drug resistance transporter [Paenibacillus qinlingensis]
MDNIQKAAPNELSDSAAPELKNRGLLLTGLIIAMLFGALDGTIVGTAMPRIVGEFGGLGLMTWLTTAYMLTSTVVVPIAGKLADLIGRRVIYVTGLIIFIVASALCGMSQNMTELILFRGLQGLGGGIMMPMAMIIIGDLFTGKQRAKWQGVFGAIFGLSSVIGPQVGGWIVDAWDWRWVFYINLPVGILAVILIAIALPKHKSVGKVKFDIPGIVTMIVGVVSLLLALTFGGSEYAWGSWQIIGLFVLAVASLTAFIFIESKAAEPILPVRLFKNRTFSTINGVGFLMAVGMFGAIMFVPLFMQGIVGISASASGTVMTPLMITMIIASVVSGQFIAKIGVRKQMLIGMIVMAVGFLFLGTMGISTTKLIASSYMVLLGLGMGLVMPILTLALQESFPKSELGVVTSSSQFFRQIGGTFGMTILGAIMNHKSTVLLERDLEPVVKQLPAEASELANSMTDMIHTNPQALYSSLLVPESLAKMPKEFVEHMVPMLKNALVTSLHSVFTYGLVFVLLGAILTLFVGNIKLSDRKKKNEDDGDEEKQVSPHLA